MVGRQDPVVVWLLPLPFLSEELGARPLCGGGRVGFLEWW